MLLFSVYDHDVITCNDFGGEAFFPLKDVPGVPKGKPTLGNFHGLKQVELALMFQENAGKNTFFSNRLNGSLLNDSLIIQYLLAKWTKLIWVISLQQGWIHVKSLRS